MNKKYYYIYTTIFITAMFLTPLIPLICYYEFHLSPFSFFIGSMFGIIITSIMLISIMGMIEEENKFQQ